MQKFADKPGMIFIGALKHLPQADLDLHWFSYHSLKLVDIYLNMVLLKSFSKPIFKACHDIDEEIWD